MTTREASKHLIGAETTSQGKEIHHSSKAESVRERSIFFIAVLDPSQLLSSTSIGVRTASGSRFISGSLADRNSARFSDRPQLSRTLNPYFLPLSQVVCAMGRRPARPDTRNVPNSGRNRSPFRSVESDFVLGENDLSLGAPEISKRRSSSVLTPQIHILPKT